MTQAQAEALVLGEKIIYGDGRIATVVGEGVIPIRFPDNWPGATLQNDVPRIGISFDADQAPKPILQIKANDFQKAEIYIP